MVTAKEIEHVLKAFDYYRIALTYCKFDKITAEYIYEHWDEDYNTIETYESF